jgi:hypothetical protein
MPEGEERCAGCFGMSARSATIASVGKRETTDPFTANPFRIEKRCLSYAANYVGASEWASAFAFFLRLL